MGRIDGEMTLAKAIQLLFFFFCFACQLLVDIPRGFLFRCSFSQIFLRSTGTYTYGRKRVGVVGGTFDYVNLLSITCMYTYSV